MRTDPYPNKEYENARYRECVYCGPLTETAELRFDSGSSEPSVGDVLVGATSADYGTVVTVTLESGAWEESLGDELVLNGGFDSDTTGWAGISCAIASVEGGVSGKCLEITRVDGDIQRCSQGGIRLYAGVPYKIQASVKSGTSGDESFSIYLYRAGAGTFYADGTTTGEWTQFSIYGTPTKTDDFTFYVYKSTATAGTMLFDSVTVKRVELAGGDAVGTIELSTLSGVDQDRLEVFEDNEEINITGGDSSALTANGVGIIKRHGFLYPEQEMTKVDGRWFCNDHYQMRFPSKYLDEYRVEGSEEDLKDDD